MNVLDIKKRAFMASVTQNFGFIRTESGTTPLTLPYCMNKYANKYIIYGNTVDNQGVGDLVTDGENIGKYKISVVNKGNNLFDQTRLLNIYRTNGCLLQADGSYRIAAPGAQVFRIDIPDEFKENTSYYFKFNLTTSDVINPAIYIYYTDGTTANKWLTDGLNTIVTSSNKTLTSFAFGRSGGNGYFYVSDLIISISNIDYVPYRESVTTDIYVNEPLKKTGDYADYIDFKRQTVVYYNNCQPTEQNISLPFILLKDGTNIISADTTIPPSSVTVEYNASVKGE